MLQTNDMNPAVTPIATCRGAAVLAGGSAAG